MRMMRIESTTDKAPHQLRIARREQPVLLASIEAETGAAPPYLFGAIQHSGIEITIDVRAGKDNTDAASPPGEIPDRGC